MMNRMFVRVAFGIGAGLMVAGGALASPVAAASLRTWANEAWERLDRQPVRVSEVGDLLPPLPVQGGQMLGLSGEVERFDETLRKQATDRSMRIAEIRGELQEALASNDQEEALQAVVELYVLSSDKAAVLGDPIHAEVVSTAQRDARIAEDEGRWMEALGLYSQLNALFEQSRRYEIDLRRVAARIGMLRLYAPERLHTLRSEARVRAGEDPLPAYNDLGEDWREKIEGVSDRMVIQAIGRAADAHVERTGMDALMRGGLDALRTFATTTDLSEVFPKLREVRALGEFLAEIDFIKGRIDEDRVRANPMQALLSTMEAVVSANARTLQLPREVLMHEFGNGAVGVLDEYTAIIWPDEREQFERSMQGAFSGVGIQISLNEALELEVVTPLSGTPAFHAGIRAKDIISHIDGQPTVGINLNQAVDQITGPAGSTVTLTIDRPGEDDEFDVRLVRARIPIHSVKGWERTGEDEVDGWNYFIDEAAGIGYLRVTQFNKDTTREASRVIRAMQRDGLNGLIVDLRYNPGGLLSEAVGLTNLFVDSGVIVTQEDRNSRTVERHRARGSRLLVDDHVPVVVLTNEGSASASEIVAGALQDLDRALIVGERTFGKGSVQQVFEVGRRPSALFKLTTGYYKLPNGRLIHRDRRNSERWGVEPDVTVELLPKQVGDALELRREADAYTVDGATGRPMFEDPSPLIREGMDPQLEAALLVLRARVAVSRVLDELAAADATR